jgi:hypothetical protein
MHLPLGTPTPPTPETQGNLMGIHSCELNKSHIISTDEDPGLQIESFAVINLRGVSTNKTIICFIAMQTYKELNINIFGISVN